MAPPVLKMKFITEFPANVSPSGFVTVSKSGLTYTFGADYRVLAEELTVDPAHLLSIQDIDGSFYKLTVANLVANSQPLNAKLTALGGMDDTVGLVEQTGAATFTKRTIGASSDTDVPTRLDADGRYRKLSVTVAPDQGGTGLTSFVIGDLIFASGATTLATLAGVATGNALISGGVGTAPAWGKIGLTTHVSGTLPVASGGTGNTTFTAYSVVCAGTTATGAFQNVSGLGTSGQVLTSAGAGALPTWQTPAAGAAAATQAEMEAGSSTSVVVTPGRQHFHPSAPKAWANFNGTGTPAFRETYLCTGITDSGTGDYTVTFTPTFTGVTYCSVNGSGAAQSTTLPATVNTVDINSWALGSSTATDPSYLGLALLGDLT